MTIDDEDFLKVLEKKLDKTIDQAIDLTATYKVDKNFEQASWVRIGVLVATRDIIKAVMEAVEHDDVPDR